MRQATEFKQEPWETLGGAAESFKKLEKQYQTDRIPNHTGIDRQSSARGRVNALAARRAKRS